LKAESFVANDASAGHGGEVVADAEKDELERSMAATAVPPFSFVSFTVFERRRGTGLGGEECCLTPPPLEACADAAAVLGVEESGVKDESSS
jgi:hypothetical protein